MKVAFIGATGGVGQRVLPELSARGHQVTAISTHPEAVPDLPGVTSVKGDANDPDTLVPLIRDHDVIVSCIQFKKTDHAKLIEAVKAAAPKRYFVCGGSGTLLAPGTTTRIMDTPAFPPAFAQSASYAAAFFDRINQETDLNWTYLSPPPGFAPGERTGVFRTGKDELIVGPDGTAAISYEDYAIAMVDELEQDQRKGRFTIGY